MAPSGQYCQLPAFSQRKAKCDLMIILKVELFRVIQHGNHNIYKYLWHGVSPKCTVFMGTAHASKPSKNTERWKTIDFVDHSLI